jgi:hypothetical protein
MGTPTTTTFGITVPSSATPKKPKPERSHDWAFVNEKVVDGVTYILWRDTKNPKKTHIETKDDIQECKGKAREVWNDHKKLKEHG